MSYPGLVAARCVHVDVRNHTLLGLPIIHGEMGSLLGTYCQQSPAETSHLASQFQVAVSVVVCLFQPRCPVDVQRCHFGTADMCVTTQTDLYLGVAHGWDNPAWWPLEASTWMLGIIPYSVFLSYMVRWVASLGRIADSHLQNFSPSVSVPGCCVCRRLFVLFVMCNLLCAS